MKKTKPMSAINVVLASYVSTCHQLIEPSRSEKTSLFSPDLLQGLSIDQQNIHCPVHVLIMTSVRILEEMCRLGPIVSLTKSST